MILAGTRVNSLFHMVITNFYLTDSECTFTFDSVLKHSRQGFDASPITFRAFPQEPDLCPVTAAKIYLKYRLTISSDIGFFVATTKPHGAASSSTIARWIKETLSEAGIDTGRFTAHSCRASSTSAASLAGIDIITITKSAGWSSDSTFYKHYKKDIILYYKDNFGFSLLQACRPNIT